MSQLKRTPIYQEYDTLGAKLIDFGGWELPVSFSGIISEHKATRNEAGLFDVSHMGEIFITGPDSLSFLQKVLTNDVAALTPNKAQYTFICSNNGGTIDDGLIYMLAEQTYMFVANAMNMDKALHWLNMQKGEANLTIKNQSNEIALLAIQGPKAVSILQQLTEENITDIVPFQFKQDVQLKDFDNKALISRTGYTGEDGFEIYLHRNEGSLIWKRLLESGKKAGLKPAGLGARDSLRLEAGLPLYGQEIAEHISPIEAGLRFAVKINKKENFIGKATFEKQICQGTERKLVGLELMEKGIAREGYPVFHESGNEIGYITSGSHSPTLKKAIAFALIKEPFSKIDSDLYVQIRKRKIQAKIVKTPFYTRVENTR